MHWVTWSGEVIILVTAVVGLAVAILNHRKATTIDLKVNGNITSLSARIGVLTAELTAHHIEVPPDPSPYSAEDDLAA